MHVAAVCSCRTNHEEEGSCTSPGGVQQRGRLSIDFSQQPQMEGAMPHADGGNLLWYPSRREHCSLTLRTVCA